MAFHRQRQKSYTRTEKFCHSHFFSAGKHFMLLLYVISFVCEKKRRKTFKVYFCVFILALVFTIHFLLFFYSFCFFLSHSVKTNLNSMGAVSRLYIANANRNDSGNYTCSLGESAQTTISVHVLNGKIKYYFYFKLFI